jgi:PAS domain S-box-containing protein
VKNYRILIVDDEPDNIRVIRNIFQSAGESYIIYQALTGELAITIAKTELPDLIITDWEMPGMDGIELIKRLKVEESISDVPVIMCTGVMVTSENLCTALNAGAVDYIRKPIDKIELIARVKSMLELSESKNMLKKKYLEIEQNSRFTNILIESIPNPFVYYTIEGTIIGCNSHFQNISELVNYHLIGTSIYDYWGRNNKEIHIKNDQMLLKDGNILTYENELGGRVFLISKTLYYRTLSKPEGIMCMMTDITELKMAHQEILENKKRELTSNALRLIHLSKLNNKLVSDLEKIKEYTLPKGVELIKNAINQVNLNSRDNIWQEFETRFENVYESFYQSLNKRFPQLTPGEKKLCALLRLNLSSKDIATLTFQDPKSVDMARYRLRKKMNLKQDENLIDFLMKIN